MRFYLESSTLGASGPETPEADAIEIVAPTQPLEGPDTVSVPVAPALACVCCPTAAVLAVPVEAIWATVVAEPNVTVAPVFWAADRRMSLSAPSVVTSDRQCSIALRQRYPESVTSTSVVESTPPTTIRDSRSKTGVRAT